MLWNENDQLLRAGFAAVAMYDRATYARMQNATWRVATDVRAAFPGEWRGIIRDPSFIYNIPDALGLTLSDKTDPHPPIPETLINPEAMDEWTQMVGVHMNLAVAATLVHEFTHIHQTAMDERMAFTAQAEFAAKLPGPDGIAIKRQAYERLASLDSNGEYTDIYR